MNPITYSQIQELINKLPSAKLPLVYNLLLDLAKKEEDELSPQLHFMVLPLEERRRMMTHQAKQMIAHYAQGKQERQEWQAGDFIDEY